MKKELFYIEKIREELNELERIVKKEGKEKRERKEKLYSISILEIISFDLEELKELVWKEGEKWKMCVKSMRWKSSTTKNTFAALSAGRYLIRKILKGLLAVSG